MVTSIDTEKLIALLTAWDDMDNAAQRILTAQPFHMTSASEGLDKCRLEMRKAIQDFAYRLPRKETSND